jgi:hypothetical protein
LAPAKAEALLTQLAAGKVTDARVPLRPSFDELVDPLFVQACLSSHCARGGASARTDRPGALAKAHAFVFGVTLSAWSSTTRWPGTADNSKRKSIGATPFKPSHQQAYRERKAGR